MRMAQDRGDAAITVDPAVAGDVERIAALHAQTFPRAWTPSDVGALLKGPGGLGFVARRNGQAIGFLIGRVALDDAELMSIGVLASDRRRGIARDLLVHLEQALSAKGASALFLEVDVANGAAVRFYRSEGFCQVGLRKLYYKVANGRRSDALVMRRTVMGGAGEVRAE